MKFKEKLAEEYLSPHFIDKYEGYDLTEEEIYLAGFEKAREMAAKIAYSPEFDGTGDAIDELGEEEVEDAKART